MEKPWLKFYDPHVPPHLDYPNLLLQDLLDQAADQFPDRVAVFFFGGKVKYAELRGMSNRFAHALKSIGLGEGDGLGLILPNMPQTIMSAFGALKAGVTPFFFDPLADDEDLKGQINDSGVKALVVLDLLLPRVDPIFSKTKVNNFIIAGVPDFLPFPRNFFFSLAARGRGIHVKVAKKQNIHPFRQFLEGGNPAPPSLEKAPRPQDVAAVQYIRGKDGRQTGALLTHKNLVANVVQVSTWMGKVRRGEETFFSILPFHQVQGMTLGLDLPIYLAAASVQLPRFEPVQFLDTVKKHRPSVLPLHPSMIEAVVWNPNLAKFVSSVHTYVSVGERLTEEVLQNFERKAAGRIVEGYGADVAPLTHANPVSGTRKSGSVGIPLPDTEAKIVDPEKGAADLPPGKTGELIVRGPQITEGYWNRAEGAEKAALRDGWLHTGDLAWMDEDGFFFFVGKKEEKK